MNEFEDKTNDCDEIYSLSSDCSEIILDDEVYVRQAPLGNSEIMPVSSMVPACSGSDNRSSVVDPKILQQIVNDNLGLKKILFRNHVMEPISFLLLLHDFGMELKLSKLIEDCGGVVYSHVKDIDGFTAVLVKDESLYWPFTGPVFRVSFISACIQAKKVVDIAPFFKSSVQTKFISNFDYMSVIYFKKCSWKDVPSNFTSPMKSYNKSVNESFSLRRNRNSSDEDSTLTSETLAEKDGKKKTVNKHSRMPYSPKEDENIIRYIVKKKAYDNLGGNSFWKVMEARDVCPCRTWQSMKEHFRKKIIYNLDCFKFLSDDQKNFLKSSRW